MQALAFAFEVFLTAVCGCFLVCSLAFRQIVGAFKQADVTTLGQTLRPHHPAKRVFVASSRGPLDLSLAVGLNKAVQTPGRSGQMNGSTLLFCQRLGLFFVANPHCAGGFQLSFSESPAARTSCGPRRREIGRGKPKVQPPPSQERFTRKLLIKRGSG